MHRVNVVAVAVVVTLGFLAGFAIPASAPSVTAFEGARLIVGDGRVIEHATLVVEGARIAQVGPTADVRLPAGVSRMDLSGKTVMPMLIDTHVHLSPTRDALIRDLRLRAYYGVSAALSLGTDTYEMLDVRGQTIPDAARFLSAGRGITMPEPGRTTVPYWITTEAEGRKAVQDVAGPSGGVGRHHVRRHVLLTSFTSRSIALVNVARSVRRPRRHSAWMASIVAGSARSPARMGSIVSSSASSGIRFPSRRASCARSRRRVVSRASACR